MRQRDFKTLGVALIIMAFICISGGFIVGYLNDTNFVNPSAILGKDDSSGITVSTYEDGGADGLSSSADSNGNVENEISEYTGISKQYLKEKLNNYIECNGSQVIYDIDNPLNIFNNATCTGFFIDEYEFLPVTLMTTDNTDILLNIIIIVG